VCVRRSRAAGWNEAPILLGLTGFISYIKISKIFQQKNLQNRFFLYKSSKKWSVQKTTLRRFFRFSRKSSRIFAEKKVFLYPEKRPFGSQKKRSFVSTEKRLLCLLRNNVLSPSIKKKVYREYIVSLPMYIIKKPTVTAIAMVGLVGAGIISF
tara:strand:+ start:91 stop:549 length:459 start_codon:yes stop_codon:yes gene_type:complete